MISRLSEVSATRNLTGVNRPINAQTGTTYTLVFDDRGKILEFNNVSAVTVTVPADSTTSFYDGDVMEVVQTGAGRVTFSPAGGVTINGFGGFLSLSGQWDSATLIKRSANTWELLSKNTTASTLTTKGDLLVTNGSVLNRLAVGTNDLALLADSAATNGVKWGQIPAAGLATNAVTTVKITDLNVTTAKIADGAITAAKLDAAVLGGGTIPMDGSVTTAKIVDLNVTTAKLADNAVTTAKILNSNVTEAKIADNAVTTAKILNSNVTEAKLADNAVTQAKLADRAVGSAELTSLTLNAQTVSYTPVLTDAHKLVTMNSGSALNFTIPTDASVNFQIGDQINILQLGLGAVTISAVTPGTTSVVSQGSKFKTNGQYAMATAVKVAANNWVVVGNLAV